MGFEELAAREHHQPSPSCQHANVTDEVETIQALDFQRDVPVQ